MDIISKWHSAQVIYHYLEGSIPETECAMCRPTAEFSQKNGHKQQLNTILIRHREEWERTQRKSEGGKREGTKE